MAFSCFVQIPENSAAVLTVAGQVPEQSSYVFFGITPADASQSVYWYYRGGGLGGFCQVGAVLGDEHFPTFSGQYIENKINMPPQFLAQSCSSLTSITKTLSLPPLAEATWYGVSYFMHTNWHGFGIYGYPAHSVTATLSW